ncbi:putative MORF4 family-associated protein 1-like protein UPP isoform X1 [Acinonyx jubatus]|uniref:MORF4 family-associated protein 1-like protein UPP isoform X1 n=1 Tax=Acinonyx jubatus TaxID=32536 RepID=A0A6J2ARC9_ACIJB|nr:putative MORF4 family-associated protein 1-like protein UPP isoform X1 [Acinonyx jubatus]
MWPEGAEERRGPEQPRDRPRSPARAALEREHVRAHLRARLKLLEVGILLDRLQSEVDSVEGAVGQGRCGSGEAEERVLKLYEKAERKAAEVARMGRRIVELHGQIDSCGFSRRTRAPVHRQTLGDRSADALEKLKPENLLFSILCFSVDVVSTYTVKSAC